MIKLSDYVFQFLKDKGIKDVFMLPGGGAMHLVDSLGYSGINYTHFQHEQAASIATEAYGQHTNHLGVLLVTSGPGGTNAITGVTAGWIDSTPMLILSGQAKRSDLVGNKGVRQIGSQEVQIISMISPVVKYAVQVLDPYSIRYHLERAYFEATTGRKGPVWIDIPLDVQATMLDANLLKGYNEPKLSDNTDYSSIAKDIISRLAASERPVILAGNGIYSSGACNLFEEFESHISIPVQTTWKALDLSYEEHPLFAGHPGLLGDRGANFIIQRSDLFLSLGARVDNSITAFNEKMFAPDAYKIIVDIDKNELKKFSMNIDMAICADVRNVLEAINSELKDKRIEKNEWMQWCKSTRGKYPVVNSKHKQNAKYLSGYYFTDCLCEVLDDDDVIVPESAGVTVEATIQAFKSKRNQKNKHAAGLGSMGFGLPYAIGACIANGKHRTVLINGDGAFQLNIQELETLRRLNLPIKIFIWNNCGYASIRGMQRKNFGGHYVASNPESGCTIPSISKIALAYDIPTTRIDKNDNLKERIKQVLDTIGPVLCEVMIDPDEVVAPKVVSSIDENGKMIPGTLDNMWPYIE